MEKKDKVEVLILKQIDSVGSFDSSIYKVGEVYEVGVKLAEVLIKEGLAKIKES